MDNNGSAYRLLKNVVDTLNCKYKIFPVAGLIIGGLSLAWFLCTAYCSKRKQWRSETNGHGNRSVEPEKPRVSIFASDLIFKKGTYDLIERCLDPLVQLADHTQLYVFFEVSNESDIANILASLDSAGAFRGGLMKHRVLFSQTSAGRGSMVRQLQPRIHMETNAAVVQAITGKVANIMHYVAGNGASEASQIDDKSGQCVPISVESTAAIVDIILPFVAET
ncbi:putative integral membrane protein [Babesia bovis T2Bo]|uniref:putative integral membrane protein n=1 Tax=Babesia bovis T2Bo TaxID=484906 RepID=UPI001C34DEF6|nr:putative integral membrane protein [Babesia bovis T2Bo]EDO08006.2 putative integral membrane protein [Babesia bovis T2Bo]